MPKSRNRSSARPNSCFVDFNWNVDVNMQVRGEEGRVKRTVKRCSRSRLGMVDGAKCSFLRITCLMILRRSRIARIRDSAVPNTDDE